MSKAAPVVLVCRVAACFNGFCPATQVGPNDSLNSIALRFNITPNKLVQLNKLFSRSVYPGQVRSRRRRSSLLPPAASRSLWLFSQKLFVPDANQPEQEHQNPALTNGVADNVSAVRIRPAQTGSVDGEQFRL